MIVVCEGCDRRFQLDDARIPERGARVRCKRCHHRFRVFPPKGATAEPAHPSASADPAASGDQTLFGRSLPDGELRFVNEPPEAGSAVVADADADSGPEPVSESASGRTAAEATSSSAPEPASGVPAAPAAAPPAAPPVASATGGEGSWEFADSSLSFDQTAAGQSPPAAPPDPEVTGAGSSQTGPGISLPADAPIEYDPSAIETPLPGSGPDPNIFDLSGNAAYGQALELDGAQTSAAEAAPGDESGDAASQVVEGAGAPTAEIGSAADWDRLAGEEPQPEPSRPSAAAEPVSAGHDLADDDLSFELDFPAAMDARSGQASRAPWLEHVGWALSLVLLLAVAQGSVRIEPSVPEVPPGQVELLGLSAENVRGRFVETARSGTLFVVSGELHNRGRDTLRPGRPLQVVLLDAEDRPLPHASALVGTELPESAVRELPLGVLALQEGLRAQALAGWALGPGEGVAFHALVSEVPDSAVRFRIQPASGAGAAAGAGIQGPLPDGATPPG